MPPVMQTLHDASIRERLRQRVESLRPDREARWGKMSVDQMLWHVNGGLDMALGRMRCAPMKAPLPRPLMRFLVLAVPWPKGAPTLPELQAKERYDFDAEHARCLTLLGALADEPIDGVWPDHPGMGPMSGRQWSALMAKHVDYHLTQFGA
jgi:DinB superfamily